MRKIERAITLVCIIALVPCIMEQETDLELFILTTETMTESRFFFTFSNWLEIVTLNLTFNMGILVNAIRNTNQTPIFEDNLQPAPMVEEIQSAQRAEKQRKWA